MTELELKPPPTSSVLFVIWSNGRHRQEEILRDLGERFQISGVYEVAWSRQYAIRNFQRFYSDIDVRGIYHSINKGTGPFLAITVTDKHPIFERRMTSRGMRYLNARFLDAKTTYRAWAGEYGIHSSENDWETNRDMFMLFNKDMTQYLSTTHGSWNGEVKEMKRDLTGAKGWRNEKELIGALNRAVEYVIVPGVVNSILVGSNDAVNILARDPRATHAVMAAQPSEFAPIGGRYRVRVSDLTLDVGIRYPGDRFFPDALAEQLLASRSQFQDNEFHPDNRTAFSAMAYHFLVHKPVVSESQCRQLVLAASSLGISGWTPEAIFDPGTARRLLNDELSAYSAEISRPHDATVYFNRRMHGSRFNLISVVMFVVRDYLRRPAQKIYRGARQFYWQSRDTLIRRFPWLRALKHGLAG